MRIVVQTSGIRAAFVLCYLTGEIKIFINQWHKLNEMSWKTVDVSSPPVLHHHCIWLQKCLERHCSVARLMKSWLRSFQLRREKGREGNAGLLSRWRRLHGTDYGVWSTVNDCWVLMQPFPSHLSTSPRWIVRHRRTDTREARYTTHSHPSSSDEVINRLS